MSIEKITREAVEQINNATPSGVAPTIETREPSKQSNWAVIALIATLVGVYGLVLYIGLQIFDAIIYNKPEAIVLAQFSNQREFSLAILAILGLLVASVVWAATKLQLSASLGAARFEIGDKMEVKEPVKVTVEAPNGSPVNVDTPAQYPQPDPEIPEKDEIYYGP